MDLGAVALQVGQLLQRMQEELETFQIHLLHQQDYKDIKEAIQEVKALTINPQPVAAEAAVLLEEIHQETQQELEEVAHHQIYQVQE